MLGENGIRAFHLDRHALVQIAARIGPSPQELAAPLDVLPAGGFSDVYTQVGTSTEA
jgi:hypothetical protein